MMSLSSSEVLTHGPEFMYSSQEGLGVEGPVGPPSGVGLLRLIHFVQFGAVEMKSYRCNQALREWSLEIQWRLRPTDAGRPSGNEGGDTVEKGIEGVGFGDLVKLRPCKCKQRLEIQSGIW